MFTHIYFFYKFISKNLKKINFLKCDVRFKYKSTNEFPSINRNKYFKSNKHLCC